jgi:hypothetical protein
MAVEAERGAPATLSREIAERMADTVPDLSQEWRECSAWPVQRDRTGHAVRVSCFPRDRVPTKLPAGIQRWIWKTPAFTLDNPHVGENGVLYVDIVPTDHAGDGSEGGRV